MNKTDMLKRITAFILLALSMVYTNDLFAQDPQFTQFYANPLYLNPAMAGTARCPRFCLNYRNQWPAISGNYVTYSASYDQHVDALGGGIGILVTNDRAGRGILNTTNAGLMYSYQLNVSRKLTIKFGLQANYFQKSIDWSRLTFGDMIDERRGFIYDTREVQQRNSKAGVDFSAGAFAYTKRFYGGFAAHHITQPDEGLITSSKLPLKITGHVGALLPIGDKSKELYISPNIIYQRQQTFQQLNLGMYISKGSIVGGLYYRNKDAFIVLLGFQQQFFRIGYSYDVTVSKLTNATAGSHEISCSLVLECRAKKKRFATVNCPSF
jgi:type IX secretion system PorP/SprF family membrane protein